MQSRFDNSRFDQQQIDRSKSFKFTIVHLLLLCYVTGTGYSIHSMPELIEISAFSNFMEVLGNCKYS